MGAEWVVAVVLFAAAMSGTPGPNNMMVMASGLNFGVMRTLPHNFGITLGFGLMVVLVGLGLGEVFSRYPAVFSAMKLVGMVYLLWLAWAIARSGPMKDGEARGRPFSFLQAAAFQWVNPKAWIIAVGAISAYAKTENFTLSVLLIGLVFTFVPLPCTLVWTGFGAALRNILRDPAHVRWLNWSMAALLVLSLWPIVSEFLTR